METDRIKAAKFFGIDTWPRLKLAALKLALCLPQCEWTKRDRVCARFKVGAAYSYYSEHPDLFWDD